MWDALFSLKFCKIIYKFEVIENINESVFNNIQWDYSFIQKDASTSILNSCFGENFGLILAITIESLLFSFIRTGEIDCKYTVEFIHHQAWYQRHSWFNLDKMLIIINNVRYQT